MKYDRVIKNGRVITSSRELYADIGIIGDRIAAVGENLSGKDVIDAAGKLVTPGAVDIHVHLQMNIGAFSSSDDFFEGTMAAACGGTTTIVDFVEPGPEESLSDALKARRSQADPKVVIDYGLHMTIGPGQMDKLSQVSDVFKEGTGGFKMYMAYGLRLNDGQLLDAMQAIKEAGGMPIIHAENWDVIQTLISRNVSAGRTTPEYHPESRPELLEGEAVARVISIAEYVGVPLHIFHISCGAAVDSVTAAKHRGVRVTGETCPQYLFINKDLHKRTGVEGALPVCSPPLRGMEEQERMWKAVSRGEIDVISTDHCPFTREEKAAGLERFDKIPGGVPGIEMRFSALYSGAVRSGLITPSRWVEICCKNPAEVLGFKRKGDIAPGFDADLVIFNPDDKWIVSPDSIHETAGWTPYNGLELTGKPETILSRGEVIVKDGDFLGKPGRGRFIKPNE